MFTLLGMVLWAQLSPVHCSCPGWTCDVSGLKKDGWEACALCLQWLSTDEEETRSERFARRAKNLIYLYRAVGYLDASVEYETKPLDDTVHLLINIQEGTHYIIREIILEGIPEEATPSELKELWSELLIAPKTECNPTFAEVSARRLLNTGLFESVTFELVKNPELGVVDVIYRLKRHPAQ